MIVIERLTGWILLAFLSFAPKIMGCRMGTAPNGDKARAFPSNFFRNLRNFLSFPARPTTCDLRSTPSSHPLLFRPPSLSPRGHSLSHQGHPLSPRGHSLSQTSHPLSPGGQALSKPDHSLSPQARFALSWRRIALSSSSECGRLVPPSFRIIRQSPIGNNR